MPGALPPQPAGDRPQGPTRDGGRRLPDRLRPRHQGRDLLQWDHVASTFEGRFPNEAAVIHLGGAVLIDIHDEWVSAERRYFSEGSMATLYAERDNDDATVSELEPAD